MEEEDSCFFQCGKSSQPLITSGPARIKAILKASKQRADDRDTINALQQNFDRNPSLTICCHKNCVSEYTSKQHIRRCRSNEGRISSSEQPPKRIRRSEVSTFNFLEHCIFCGRDCVLERDKRNPSRWRPSYPFRTIQHKTGATPKEAVLERCNEREDEWGREVSVRLHGAVSDLHAADARYHDDGRK